MALSRTLGALAIVLVAQPTAAGLIDYELKSIGGDSYRYDYTVTNDGSLGAGLSIAGFTILFDPALYDEFSLSILTPDPPAADWDELILGSGVGVPAAYDALAFSSGIAPGDSVSGFSVSFTWLGTSTPGAQSFEIYDPSSFDILATGQTTVVPVPPALALFLSGALGLLAAGRRRRKENQPLPLHA